MRLRFDGGLSVARRKAVETSGQDPAEVIREARIADLKRRMALVASDRPFSPAEYYGGTLPTFASEGTD